MYQKHYSKCNKTLEIELKSDTSKSIIHYQNIGITCERATTCDFHQEENKVVLECVNRLLEIGYKPENIILEKKYSVGRNSNIWCDILIKRPNGKTYALVECKNNGNDYNDAKDILYTKDKNGGQLFSYFQQDNNADYLILYSSDEKGYNAEIINTKDIKKGKNQEEKFELWDKTSISKGFFETEPYNEISTKLKKCDLKDITQYEVICEEKNNTGTIYNRFAEILRRYTISDKSNAYNKIFNLFLCKIVDEIETNNNEELKFQWGNNETAIDVLSRLNTLYKTGMKDYLKLTITDYDWETDIKEKLNNLNEPEKENLKNIFTELRLYKNNEFAFQEVIDKTTFEKNAEIVEKVVKLLQPYKLKYSNKQQFLGDFFEKLLNIGIKQENGQFFTPIPIVRFINYCIPYEDIIAEKIKNRNANCLPKVIDYACGSGHFLTEAMDRVQKQIDIEATKPHNNNIQDNLDNWKTKTSGGAYKWAEKFIFGIEKDYRLAKTTKIACFLNGDGDANIFFADGLASFDCKEYENKINEGDFDIIIANPPYSVKCFKSVLQNKDFELYDKITNNNSNIECFFIERTKQLLKEGGMCGIILPSSILSNVNIAIETRKIFLKYFDLIGIQELFENIFASTGTNTIILFAKKHDKIQEYNNIKSYIENFINTQQDFSYNNNNNVIDAYCKYTNTAKEKLLQDLTDNDKSLEKLTLFISNYNKKCVISTYDNNTDSGKLGKQFIGFEYSTRKGHEGLHPYPDNATGKVASQLYTDDNILDDKKVNYYFYNAFRKQYPEVHKNLKDNVKYADINDLFNFEKKEFDYEMNTKIRPRQEIDNFKYDCVKLTEIVELLQKEALRKEQLVENGEYPVINAGVNLYGKYDKYNNDCEAIIVSSHGENAGFVSYMKGKFWAGALCFPMKIKNKNILTKYVYIVLKEQEKQIRNLRSGKAIPFISSFNKFSTIKIPIPSIQTQQQIVEKFDEIEKKQEENRRKIASNNDKIFEVIDGMGERKEPIIFTEFVKTIQPRIKLQKQEWLSKGDYPIISQETNNLISGYTNNEEAVIKEKPIIAFGDHTLCVKYIDFDFCYGADGMQLLKVDNTKIDTKLFSYILKNRLKEIDDKKYSRHFSKVKLLKFKLPSLETKHQLLQQINQIEKENEELKREIEALEQQKKEFLDKYLK